MVGIDVGGDLLVIVIDIGGIIVDVGIILFNGFFRQVFVYVFVVGVWVNYFMFYFYLVGFGGGFFVWRVGGKVCVGFGFIGYYFYEDVLVFGGNICIVLDIVVVFGMVNMGDKIKVFMLEFDFIQDVRRVIDFFLEGVVDMIKIFGDFFFVILVGGGVVLVLDDIVGVFKVIWLFFYDVVNVIGVVILCVSGIVDIV